MTLPRLVSGLAGALLGALLVGCDPAAPAGPTGAEVLEQSLDRTIVPDLSAFAAAATSMQASTASFCGAPDSSTLEALQESWRALALSWNRVAAYNIGPLNNDLIVPRILFVESMRQRGTDYTETVREELDRALTGDHALDQAFFDGLTFTKVGLLALEVLVFEDSRDGSTSVVDIVADYEAAPRKCAYLKGVMGQLVTVAEAVDEGWRVDDGTGQPFRDQMLGAELPDGSEPVAALIVALFEHLDYTKDRKLEGILDAQLSGKFYPHASAMLDALERLLDPSDSLGFVGLMEARGFVDEAGEVRANLAAAQKASAAGARDDLATAIGLLEGNLKREIPDSLGIFLGINFSDGD